MLENTLETLAKVDPLLDAGDTESAGKLLLEVDQTSLCALIIHIIRERGVAVAEVVAAAYLRAAEAGAQQQATA